MDEKGKSTIACIDIYLYIYIYGYLRVFHFFTVEGVLQSTTSIPLNTYS